MEKRIEVVQMRAGDIGTDFGNPRKIRKKKREELEQSLDTLGDFGIFVIDEKDNIIAGNQRLRILREKDPDTIITCKRLIGYSEAELRAVNIKDNTHSGEWDMDMLANWTADITIDLGLEGKDEEPAERKIRDMEPIRYEKYNYVMIVCRNEVDYLNLIRTLGIENARVVIHKDRKIKARAIWYDEMKARIVAEAKK